jgi:hypothetical protein
LDQNVLDKTRDIGKTQRGQKLGPNLLIKKRIAQLVDGKLGKNRYNKTTRYNNT